MNIKILNDAQNDIAKAMLFYENQKDKLGEYFLDSIMSDIESLYIYAVLDCRQNPILLNTRLEK